MRTVWIINAQFLILPSCFTSAKGVLLFLQSSERGEQNMSYAQLRDRWAGFAEMLLNMSKQRYSIAAVLYTEGIFVSRVSSGEILFIVRTTAKLHVLHCKRNLFFVWENENTFRFTTECKLVQGAVSLDTLKGPWNTFLTNHMMTSLCKRMLSHESSTDNFCSPSSGFRRSYCTDERLSLSFRQC